MEIMRSASDADGADSAHVIRATIVLGADDVVRASVVMRAVEVVKR